MKHRAYVKSPKHWKDMYANAAVNGEWTPVDRVPLERIKVDKSLFTWQNEVDDAQVEYMILNFDQEVWTPLLLNQDYYLLDGQHRLAVAKKTGMKYIDVILEDRELLLRPPRKPTKLEALIV